MYYLLLLKLAIGPRSTTNPGLWGYMFNVKNLQQFIISLIASFIVGLLFFCISEVNAENVIINNSKETILNDVEIKYYDCSNSFTNIAKDSNISIDVNDQSTQEIK